MDPGISFKKFTDVFTILVLMDLFLVHNHIQNYAYGDPHLLICNKTNRLCYHRLKKWDEW